MDICRALKTARHPYGESARVSTPRCARALSAPRSARSRSAHAAAALDPPARRARLRRDDRPREVAARKLGSRRATIAAPAVSPRQRSPPTARANGCSTSATATPSRPCSFPETDRGTLCISSQAGCALDCAFCSTGQQGFNRNLTTAEIVGQLWHANRALLATAPRPGSTASAPITNVVMMGMGEPLANYEHVVPRCAHARRQRLRPVAPPRHALDVGRGADDRPAARRRARWRWRCRCTRPTTRCATASCRINRKYPLARAAGRVPAATSSARRATSSRSST